MTIYKLQNPIREYAWGSKTAFAALFNKPAPAINPQAELWMGAHPQAPSAVLIGDKAVSLQVFINEDPKKILGDSVARKYGNKLPFLFKILACEKPLSIQAHPDSGQASAGFLREEKNRIPVDSPKRIYRDTNHKPELIVCLTPFLALNGFRPIEEILASFEMLACEGIESELARLRSNRTEVGLRDFYSFVMNARGDSKSELIDAAINKAESQGRADSRFKWLHSASKSYPFDPGILSFLFLNLVELAPLEGLFIPARRLHSYLNGIGVELMANSDNVIRGGLTEKHVDVEELLRVLSFDSSPPLVLSPQKTAPYEDTFSTGATEFTLSRIHIDKARYRPSLKKRNIEILVAIEGEGVIFDESENTSLVLNRGDSCVVPACVKDYRIEGKLTLFKATVPGLR